MWRGAYVLAIVCATVFIVSVVRANAQSDPGTDPDAVCNGKPQSNPDDLYQERLAAVFAVQVTGADGKSRRTGTATLIDQSGIFMTAAHVVHFNEEWPIIVSQKFTGQAGRIERQYRVKVMTNTDDWQTQDVVLLQALPQEWNAPGITPVPLRIDAVHRPIRGFFIGHAEDLDKTVYEEFTIAFDDPETVYRGIVFPHASGALLLDWNGRAFAMVVRDDEFGKCPLG